MNSIYNYLDYREYLEDFFNEKKLLNPHYSYRVFATQAGFSSKSFLKLVIDEKKHLSDSSVEKINSALKLPEREFEYFKDLVAFNRAKSAQQRTFYFEKLLSYKSRNSLKVIQQQHYEYFSQWYHSTIRELVCGVEFNDDFEMLAKLVKPSITARQARKSVSLLMNLGLIEKVQNRYKATDTSITTGDEVRSLAVQNFHL